MFKFYSGFNVAHVCALLSGIVVLYHTILTLEGLQDTDSTVATVKHLETFHLNSNTNAYFRAQS